MFRRLLRVTVKLGLIAAAGFAIAVVVQKLTAPAESSGAPEPWQSHRPGGASNGEDGSAGLS